MDYKNMRYTWLDEYLMKKRGVTRELKTEWNWMRYLIGGKLFAAVCLNGEDEAYYINLKLEPAEGELLRRQYEDIIPGYYSDKRCWNSVKPDGAVPDELLREMLDQSYALVLAGFSKAKQREILGLSCCGTDCSACGAYGSMCQGCNTVSGKVFHSPQGCPIYQCSVQKQRRVNCAGCGQLPCDIWRATRDPNFTDEAFEQSIRERIANLGGNVR